MSHAVNPEVLANLTTATNALAPLGLANFVFVGGAVVGLLITQSGTPDARATQDIDVVASEPSRSAFNRLEARLRGLGFSPDLEVICRWQVDGVTVDIMPPDDHILGFSNRWYPSLLEHATALELPSGQKINVASAPYMLATKLEAFKHRGGQDYLASHDLEDIIILLDGRPEIVNEVLASDEDVRSYIVTAFEQLLETPDFINSIEAHLADPDTSYEQALNVRQRMSDIANGDL